MQAIVLRERAKEERDSLFEYAFSMYLMYATRPAKSSAEIDGSHFIGDVGEAPEKNFERWCPYSLATPRRKIDLTYRSK